MTDRTPIKARFTTGTPTGLGEFESGDTVPIANGGTGATSAAAALTALGAAPASDLIGTVIFVGKNSAPTGFLKANGAAISRTTYAALFAVIGTTFGTGDGSTTFNVPDLRGEFVRGWDDSRGVDSGRSFGSAQAEALKAHTHAQSGYYTTNTTHSHSGVGGAAEGPSGGLTSATMGNTASSGGTETRPRNIALLACIRYQ